MRPIRERRKILEKDIPRLIKILKEGTDKCIKLTDNTLAEVKQAMSIDYFVDSSFEEEQVRMHENN